MAPALRYRVNEFFLRNGPTISLHSSESFGVFHGPIGSGAAVIANEDSDILDFLRRFNEKTLAVETEAGGVGQAFYEEIDSEQALAGWLTIRGISDLADRHIGHDRHQLASDHAAAVMDRLLPLLRMPGLIGQSGAPSLPGHSRRYGSPGPVEPGLIEGRAAG
jgi:adenosylhomocysteine nucleosidase